MGDYESSINSISSDFSTNGENYSRLLKAFKETHEKANLLALF